MAACDGTKRKGGIGGEQDAQQPPQQPPAPGATNRASSPPARTFDEERLLVHQVRTASTLSTSGSSEDDEGQVQERRKSESSQSESPKSEQEITNEAGRSSKEDEGPGASQRQQLNDTTRRETEKVQARRDVHDDGGIKFGHQEQTQTLQEDDATRITPGHREDSSRNPMKGTGTKHLVKSESEDEASRAGTGRGRFLIRSERLRADDGLEGALNTVDADDDGERSRGGEEWMHLRSSSLLDDAGILPVPVPSTDSEISDMPPVTAVPESAISNGGAIGADIVTADVVYPVPLPVERPSSMSLSNVDVNDGEMPACGAALPTNRAAPTDTRPVTFPDLMAPNESMEAGMDSNNNIDAAASGEKKDSLDEFRRQRSATTSNTHILDGDGDWLRDIESDQEVNSSIQDGFSNRRTRSSDAYYQAGVSVLRKSAKARKSMTSSLSSMDKAARKLLHRESSATDQNEYARYASPCSNTASICATVAMETDGGPLLPRNPLPSTIEFVGGTSKPWVLSIHTDQKSLDKGLDVQAAQHVERQTYNSEVGAIAARAVYSPPRKHTTKNGGVCFTCLKTFTMFKRRAMHCRSCGVCICSNCSTTWTSIGLPSTFNIKNETSLRICGTCEWLSHAFRQALLSGQYDEAIALHATGNVNARSPFVNVKGETLYPIHCASLGGNTALLKWLVDEVFCPIMLSSVLEQNVRGSTSCLDTPLRTSKNRSVLDIAVGKQDVDMMQYLVVEKSMSVHDLKDHQSALLSLEAALRRLRGS